ncbi:type II toxin-antitoxin system VapC family toxin [Ectothiorhodospira haloalkaliphila]|uniref:type II toxin-antitoxin system VapC family toxin n=1 Tax=Ectothiorhodospira haloalkaliphila TaxID=421628 RepID=UPI001EE7924C|nr:type II toxin-antitoxin system VapC family toxin [Ectothiorhodospira haloalkaliphila]MCG5524354.1 type II toxin-antitoxin system VapC family toxin [Ectothiorhodospira haloalkaliphila]
MLFVLDNSVTMRWLFADGSDEDLAYADFILELLEQPDNHATAPGIWPLEVANVIARAEAKGLLTEARSAEFLGALRAMAIEVMPDVNHHALDDILHLARRFRLSSYDAAYLNLALLLGAPLATLDKGLRGAASITQVPLLSSEIK